MDTHISKKDTTESPRPSQETELTLIDKYEEDYHTALAIIDNDVKELIQHGSEMKGLMLFAEQISKILEIHESLSTFYLAIYNRQEVLQHFGSEKLRQLGHDLRPIREALKGVDATEEEIERHVLGQLEALGFNRKHWYIKSVLLMEIEYMIDALRILIEPDFIPLEEASSSEDDEDQKPNRYVPSSVKIAVWRRDGGKCVECGSKEKLEYDHIIPVSEGGSNTERNIQLLCEKCNRQKAAKVA